MGRGRSPILTLRCRARKGPSSDVRIPDRHPYEFAGPGKATLFARLATSGDRAFSLSLSIRRMPTHDTPHRLPADSVNKVME
jgi:hypothetical protein